MAHDKIKAAARSRMAKTGESYAAARREVIREFRAAGSSEPERFAISYQDMGRVSTWADSLMGGGPAGGRIEVDADELRAQPQHLAPPGQGHRTGREPRRSGRLHRGGPAWSRVALIQREGHRRD
jgi:hypothetical protein